MATINEVKLIRVNNPAQELIAYVMKTDEIDPLVIRKLVSLINGRIIKLPNGDNVHKVIFKNDPNRAYYTDDAGKAALGF